jgi:hypothetical protein
MRYDIDNVLGSLEKGLPMRFLHLLRSYSGNNACYFAAMTVVNGNQPMYDGITKI